MIGVGIAAWLGSASFAAPSACEVTVDGVGATLLDCLAEGKWRIRCDVGEVGPKVRVRAIAKELALEGEALVPFFQGTTFDLPLTTAFTERGKSVGPERWCPSAPPGAPGDRAATEVTFEVVSYRQTGTVDQPLDGGVINQIPTFDKGTVVATTTAAILQRPALDGGAAPVVPDRPIAGRLQLKAPDGTWAPLELSGARSDVKVPPGAVRLLVVDLPLAQLTTLSPGDPLKYLRSDLTTWFGGDPSSMLGLLAWSKADLPPPQALAWTGNKAKAERVEVRLVKGSTKVRVVLGWREQGMDAAAIRVVDDAAAGVP